MLTIAALFSVGAAGDVNGDGLADLLIGAVYASGIANSPRTANAGESYLVYGKPTLPSTIDLGTLGAGGMTLYGADGSDLSGVSVNGAGDVNGDGYDDFLVGSFLSDGPHEFYVCRRLDQPRVWRPQFADAAETWARSVLPVSSLWGDGYFDSVGWSVNAAGDVNADGFDDLIIGATYPSDQPDPGYTAKGKTFVVYGAASSIPRSTSEAFSQPARIQSA